MTSLLRLRERIALTLPRRETVRGWVRRYGVAELAGVTTALGGSLLLRLVTGNEIAAAYGGALGENIGFYSVIIGREVLADRRAAASTGGRYGLRAAGRTACNLLLEFGPAELLDSGIIRPLAMGVGIRLLGWEWGVVAGKLVADATFYLPVLVAYELRRHLRPSER